MRRLFSLVRFSVLSHALAVDNLMERLMQKPSKQPFLMVLDTRYAMFPRALSCLIYLCLWGEASPVRAQVEPPHLGAASETTPPVKVDAYQCMADHLREAKEINSTRMPLYANLTDGESRKVSWTLIGSEAMGIPFAALMERLNNSLQEAGVNILCEDFVSMDRTPAFRPQQDGQPLPLKDFQSDRGWDEIGDFWRLGRSRSYAELARTTDVVLAELTLVPTYHCMYRHILESIRRAASKAENQLERARAKGLEKEAERVIDLLMTSQLAVLPLAMKIDDWSAPINARGIPIVCQDVPAIHATE
jgi:hypothetical protein